jgi:tetratricopeptide (TPR) repeat protein
MDNSIEQQNHLCRAASAAEQAGQLDESVQLYREAVALQAKNPTPYLFLGSVLQALDRLDEAVQVWSLAADIDPRLVSAWRNPRLPADIRQRSEAADTAMRSHYTALHTDTMAHYRQLHPTCNIERIEAAIWCQTHAVAFRYPHQAQRPHVFLVPELAAIPVFGPEHISWQHSLEAVTADIEAEFSAASKLAADAAQPYLDASATAMGDEWQPLADSLNWGAFHLYKKGVANSRLCDLFPTTLAVLKTLPLLKVGDLPSEILFSSLQAGQHIPPHYGLSNTDVTVHLPIATNSGSAIKVCDQTHQWQHGKVFAFDDAFYHESWNHGATARVNLLFEAWHPDLSTDEQGAISASFNAREQWNKSRSLQSR